MAVHYKAPGATKAACGDASATTFTSNRATVTCVPCKNAIGAGGAKPTPYPRTN